MSASDDGWARPARVYRETDPDQQYGLRAEMSEAAMAAISAIVREAARKLEAVREVARKRHHREVRESLERYDLKQQQQYRLAEELASDIGVHVKAARIQALISSSAPGWYCARHDLYRNPENTPHCWQCREQGMVSA